LFTASGAGAQAVDSSARRAEAPRPARCDSVIAQARVDTVTVRARAYLLSDDATLKAPVLNQLLQSVLATLHTPRPLALSVFSAGSIRMRMLRPEHLGDDSAGVRQPELYGVYRFTVRRRQAIDSARVEVPTLAPVFDSAVIAAITRAAADSEFATAARQLAADRVDLQLRITTGPADGRIRAPAVTLFDATLPRVPLVDARPSESNLPAEYPPDEIDDGDDGDALLRAVVGADGAPVARSIEVVRASSVSFATAAVRALTSYRYIPAHIGGCAVPQVIEVPFHFSLRP
jgi:hypothetical protein